MQSCIIPVIRPSLPLDVVALVAEGLAPSDVSDTKALASCCLVCTNWVHISRRPLYRFVYLHTPRQLTAFASTVGAFSKTAAGDIRDALVHVYRTYSINIFEDFMESPCIHLIPQLLSTKLPYLRTLNLRPWRYHGCSFHSNFIMHLSHFGSTVNHLILLDTRFQSLLDFRRIIGSLHSLSHLTLTNVKWGFNPDLHLKPLLHTTAWNLSSIDLVKCQFRWHIPILWSIPPPLAPARSYRGYMHGTPHPAISKPDALALCGLLAALPYPAEVGWMETQTATFRWKRNSNQEGTSDAWKTRVIF